MLVLNCVCVGGGGGGGGVRDSELASRGGRDV